MAMVYEVLVDPTRRRILDLLRERERSVNELVALLGLGQPGVSKHLRVLREAGLVAVRQDAQRRWYRLEPAPLAELDAWLAPYRHLWADRLDALEQHLDRHPAMPGPKDDAVSEGAPGGDLTDDEAGRVAGLQGGERDDDREGDADRR